jgi:Zn-dependent protease
MAPRRSRSLRIATVAGVPVYVGAGWAVIALVVVALVGPSIARQRPDLGVLAYGVAALFSFALLVAVLAHEAAHAVAARRYGLPVVRVVADLWGGHTAYEAARSAPGSAAVIAIVGPLANAALAALAWVLAPLVPSGVPSILVGGFALLNAALAAFNLLPGLPLDGGQLVESGVWKATGSRNRGMVAAGWCGRVVTILVVLWFLARPLALGRGLDLFDVAWTLFIASFLWTGASGAIRSGRVLARLGRIPLRGLLRPVAAVQADQTLDTVVPQGPDCDIVVLDAAGTPAALVDRAALAAVPTGLREQTPVSAVTTPQPAGWVVEADVDGDVVPVIVALQQAHAPVAVVVSGGRAVGTVRAVDVETRLGRN